ncbi:MAG: exodeoxyribonuclease V subunit gamma [bacterium]
MLYIHYSNHLEKLAEAHAATLNQPLTHVLAEEQVIVENAGVGRWLSLKVAQYNGVSANTSYLFPAEFMWQLLHNVLQDIPNKDPCAINVMRWRLFTYFYRTLMDHPNTLHEVLPKDIAQYFAKRPEESAWGLSIELANLFDQYLFFRPDWIRAWEQGYYEEWVGWQGHLWQKAVNEQHLPHWVNLQEDFIHHLPYATQLPERVSFFAIPNLSPSYLRLLGEVAKKMEVHLYVLNPCIHYWGDITAEKIKAKFPKVKQQYIEVGNELLASMGTQGRDFVDTLLELEPHSINEHYHDINVKSRLSALQYDILHLLPANQAHTTLNLDQSLQIHACHSPMREVEVLHDQLLAVLEADHTLMPDDIVIMTPDIDGYAPYIEAVFNHADQQLPFSLADHTPDHLSSSLEWLTQALQLPEQSYNADAVISLLQNPDIQARFKLDDDAIELCRYWVFATNIRHDAQKTTNSPPSHESMANACFLEDSPHQDVYELPHEHGWQQGLDRLLLGYALSEEQLFADRLPFANIEGKQLEVYAQFRNFIDQLFILQRWQQAEKPLEDWLHEMRQWLLGFFEQADLLKVLDHIKNDSQAAQMSHQGNEAVYSSVNNRLNDEDDLFVEKPLNFRLFRRILCHYANARKNDSFMQRGITFCTLVPMRSIPFRFIGLLGMNDASFPRKDVQNSFDLMRKQGRRKGDRSRRNEDRYLFLESLLAARDILYISYIGQSIRDNTSIPPSMVVGELVDYIQLKFSTRIEQQIVQHPLQAFSPHYFKNPDDPVLFSYRAYYAEHLNQINQNQAQQTSSDQQDKPFLSRAIIYEQKPKAIYLQDLIQFFTQPSRYFVNKVLNIKTKDYAIELPTREPFNLESFIDRELRQLIHNQFRQEKTYSIQCMQQIKNVSRAKGLLPHGKPGDLLLQHQQTIMQRFHQRLPDLKRLAPHSFHLTLGDFVLYDQLEPLTQKGLVHINMGKPWMKQLMQIYLTHFAFNAVAHTLPIDFQQALCLESHSYTPDESFTLPPITDAEQRLTQLLMYYWHGQQQPLAFAPKSAWAYYEAIKNGEDNTKAFKKALDCWQGNSYQTGEKDSFEHQLLFKQESPLESPDFLTISELLFA